MTGAWLIEATPEVFKVPQWWCGKRRPLYWTKDPNEALRFSRKEDAETAIEYLIEKKEFGRACAIATEHVWIDARAEAVDVLTPVIEFCKAVSLHFRGDHRSQDADAQVAALTKLRASLRSGGAAGDAVCRICHGDGYVMKAEGPRPCGCALKPTTPPREPTDEQIDRALDAFYFGRHDVIARNSGHVAREAMRRALRAMQEGREPTPSAAKLRELADAVAADKTPLDSCYSTDMVNFLRRAADGQA